MRASVAIGLVCLLGCGGAARSPSADDASPGPVDAPETTTGDTPPVSGSSPTFQPSLDSATRHCYRAGPAEVATPTESLVGCWQRTMFDGARLTLDVFENGRFASAMDGGDATGSSSGVWEANNGALVLLPSPGDCALRDGSFDDACVRLFDTDVDTGAVSVVQQLSFDELVSHDWQRAESCDGRAALGAPAPRSDGCSMAAIEPASVELEAIEIHFASYPGDVGRGRLQFSTTTDLSPVDIHDVRRNLLGSIRAFSLQTLEGSVVARFERHAPGLSEEDRANPDRSPVQDEEGEFRIQTNRGLAVDFVHPLTTLPDLLELRYEFEAAKYIVDSGPRAVRLPVRQ
jgi:hypothetical protein